MPDNEEQGPRQRNAGLLPRLWNAGNSLIGLVGAIGGRGAWRRGEKVLEVSGGWLSGLLVRRGWAQAITLGDVVLYADDALIALVHDHEMVHVQQGRVWGPFFLPAYVLESLWQYLRTRDGYHNNRFEVAAYARDARKQEN